MLIVFLVFKIEDVGFTANDTIISCPEEIPPSIPPALFDLNFNFFLFCEISSEFSSPDNFDEFIPDPILTPFTALILIIAEAISASNFEYIGAPKPAGIPFTLTSIIAPHEEPAFLIQNSWGKFNSGGHPEWGPIPDGSFLIHADVAEGMLRQNGAYAFSDFNGFPPQKLPDYGFGDYL